MFQEINPLDRPSAFAEITIMLLVASILGFFIGWLIQKFNKDKISAELRFSEDKYNTLNQKFLNQEKESRELISNVHDLRKRKNKLLAEIEVFKDAKPEVGKDSKHQIRIKELESKISELKGGLDQTKAKNEALKKQLVEEHHTTNSVDKLKNEIEILRAENTKLTQKTNNTSNGIASSDKEIEHLKQQLTTSNKDKSELQNRLNTFATNNDNLSKKLSSLESEKHALVSEIDVLKSKPVISASNKSGDNSSILSLEEIIQRKQQLIRNVGIASDGDKNLLSKINGIGPFIEAKLNSIGIFTYAQVSKLNSKDVEIVTELIEFFPGRIERDGWVKQAMEMTKKS